MSDTLGFCLYCKGHYLQDEGHSCMEARSGVTPTGLHDPTNCRQCKNAEAAANAHEQMAQYTIPGKVRVEIGWIGEGKNGDFNAANPGDEPLLRFDAYDLTKHADTLNCTGYFDCCRGAQDASYCTRLSVATPVPILESVCRHIAEAIKDEARWKKLLEELSWLNDDEAERIHKKYTKGG